MALRGTEAARAYIALTVDGDNINEQITEGVDGATREMGPAGEEGGAAYGEGFGSSLSDRLARARESAATDFNRTMGESGDESGNSFGSNFSDAAQQRLANFAAQVFAPENQTSVAGDSGEESGFAYGAGLTRAAVQGTDWDTVWSSADDTNDSAADESGNRSGNRFGAAVVDAVSGSLRERLGDAYLRATDQEALPAPDFGEAFRQSGDESGNAFSDAFHDAMADLGHDAATSLGDGVRQNREGARGGVRDALGDDFADEVSGNFSERFADHLAQRLGEVLSEQRRRVSEENDRDRSTRRIGDRVGGLLGAGSRNNGLNLFGKSVGGIINLLGNATSAAKKMFSTFQTGFSEAQAAGQGFFRSVLSGGSGALSAGFSSLASSGPAAVAAIIAVATSMTLLVTIAGALLAIVTALVATLASGLVAALLVAAGGLVAIAAGAGLVVAAFTSMTDAQSAALKTDFQPLKAELTGLGQLMITQIIPYFDTWSSNLQNALYQLTPLASVFGDAIGRAGNSITASLSGPGFALLTQQLGVYLPSIVTRLSAALGSFLNGTAGLFAALLPTVDRFAGYLADVTERFSRFANSTEGQNKISDFVDRAVASLQSLWDFTREAFGAITDIIFSPQAQTAGNNLFDDLADSIADFRKNITPQDLQKWFTDATNFAEDLGNVISSLTGTLKALYNSGVLSAIGSLLSGLGKTIEFINGLVGPMIDFFGKYLPLAVSAALVPLAALYSLVQAVGQAISYVTGNGFDASKITDPLNDAINNVKENVAQLNNTVVTVGGYQYAAPIGPGLNSTGQTTVKTPINVPSLPELTAAGNTALNNTSVDAGGYKPKPVKPPKPAYKNPYVDYANSLIKQGTEVAATIRNAILEVNKQIKGAITDATTATSGDSVASSFGSLADSIKTSAKTGVNSAQDALNSAATSLANATSKSAAKAALKKVKKSQKDLAAALANQVKINAAAKILNDQKVVNEGNVQSLLNGIFTQNATLADYAEARGRLAEKLADANQALADAISLRDQYNASVVSSITSFGSLVSAQAKTVDGVAQALTATDIVSNLQDKLKQVREFQDNLNILLTEGLSNEAYKQLVDAGVEQGGAYAAALVQGGSGAVQGVNDLTSQIAGVAADLGAQASNRLYQAGVDAAQGLVDGLTSLSAQLDSAATALGNSIAQAVKNALGIASPSKVLFSMMHDDVGDGMVNGLYAAHNKVGRAASALADQVAVSPSLATAYAEGRVPAAVSGNQRGTGDSPYFRDLVVQTPTTDPKAVAKEALNELVGRLP